MIRKAPLFTFFIVLLLSGFSLAAQNDLPSLSYDHKTKKYGYKNRDDKWVIAPKYTRAWYFEDSMAFVCKDPERCGWINAKGQVIVPLKFNDHGGLVVLKEFNKAGTMLVSVTKRSDRWQEDYFGMIDRNGKEVLPFKYRIADEPSLSQTNGIYLLAAHGSDLMGAVDYRGNIVIPFVYEYLEYAGPGRLRAKKPGPHSTTSNGLISYDNREILPFLCSEILYNIPHNIYIYKQQDKWNMCDTNGVRINSTPYDHFYHYNFADRMDRSDLILMRLNGSNGGVNGKNEILLPFEYDHIVNSHSTLPVLIRKNGKYGYCNKRGEIIVPPQYDSATGFIANYAIVTVGNLSGTIDTSGKLLMPVKYALDDCNFTGHWGQFEYSEFLCFREDSSYGLIHYSGKAISAAEFQHISGKHTEYPNREFFIVKKDGKYGVINDSGRTIIPFEYTFTQNDFGTFFHFPGNHILSDGRQWFVIDYKAETLLTAAEYEKKNPGQRVMFPPLPQIK